MAGGEWRKRVAGPVAEVHECVHANEVAIPEQAVAQALMLPVV